jgi:hypothetical protein
MKVGYFTELNGKRRRIVSVLRPRLQTFRFVFKLLQNLIKYFHLHLGRQDDEMPSLLRRILHQAYLNARTGVAPANYYRYALWRTHFSHGSVEDYLGDFYSYNWQKRLSSQTYQVLMDDKLLFSLCAEKANFPTPTVLCIFSSTVPDIHPVIFRAWDDFREWLISGQTDLFIKPLHGLCGQGVLSLGERLDADTPTWRRLPSRDQITLPEIEHHFLHGHYRHYIIQARLEPSTQLAVYSKNVLQTLRILTIRDGKKVHVVAATLKIAGGKSPVDNLLIGRNLIAPIDLDTGVLGRAVYLENDQPIRVERHPVTNQRIEGVPLQHWQESLETVHRAASLFPCFKSIGWDVALTDRGPVIVEPNYHADMVLIQLAHDRGLLSWDEFRKFFFENGLHRYIGLGLMTADK